MRISMDKISIIVPIYNVEPYLLRCVRSLTGQSYHELEILLVDDGSTDGSGRIARRLAETDSRIRCLAMPGNRGVSAARNLGLDKAAGDWICFCDGDDAYSGDFVEKMLLCAQNQGADYVTCGYMICPGMKPVLPPRFRTGRRDRGRVIACDSLSSCTHMIKKSLFDKTGARYPEGCAQYEEMPVMPLLAAKAEKTAAINEPLYFYWQRGDGSSASNADPVRYEESYLRAEAELRRRLGGGYGKELEFRAVYALHYGMILNLCKHGASRREICGHIERYEREYPDYLKNPYLEELGAAKRAFLEAARHRDIAALRAMAWVHGRLVG